MRSQGAGSTGNEPHDTEERDGPTAGAPRRAPRIGGADRRRLPSPDHDVVAGGTVRQRRRLRVGGGLRSRGRTAAPSATPVPTPLPANIPAKPGDIVIRWYCCLGTGDGARRRSRPSDKVADAFNASHPGIHLRFEGYVYDAARDALSVQLASGNGPDIVGPVGIGGAERVPRPVARPAAAHRQEQATT